MLERRAREDPLRQPVRSHEPCEKGVRKMRRDDDEHGVHRDAPPRRHARLRVGVRLAEEEPLERAVDELHVDRLRARPSAPDASEDRREQEDAEEDGEKQQREQQGLGRAEDRAEEDELALDEVEEDRRHPADRRPRDHRVEHDEDPRHHEPPSPPRAVARLGSKPAAASVLLQRGEDATLGLEERARRLGGARGVRACGRWGAHVEDGKLHGLLVS